eukprot:9620152-Alexandrium_andersonii.AAC.1
MRAPSVKSPKPVVHGGTSREPFSRKPQESQHTSPVRIDWTGVSNGAVAMARVLVPCQAPGLNDVLALRYAARMHRP